MFEMCLFFVRLYFTDSLSMHVACAWQGAGRLNALATLTAFSTVDLGADTTGTGMVDAVAALAPPMAPPGVPPTYASTGEWGADGTRVLFAGHSMGGHGIYHSHSHLSFFCLTFV